MRKTRQAIPRGLAAMPPGPTLAAMLATIDLSRLSGTDCVAVLRARQRQASHEQAQLMAAMVEVALCGIGPDDALPRIDAPDEFAADEIRGALAWTRSAANSQLDLAWDLIHRLGPVYAALDAGSIDVPKARVFSEWTGGLTADQVRQICDRLLPEAPDLTTGQLCERIKRMAIALDPDWSRRRYEDAVRSRKVVGYRNEDGTGNVCGISCPPSRRPPPVPASTRFAKKVKHAGDGRPIDHIRADVFVRMLDGSYTGWSEPGIIAHLLTLSEPPPAGGPDNEGAAVADPTAGDGGAAGEHTAPAPRRAGVEIRAEITMLLGLNRRPGEIAQFRGGRGAPRPARHRRRHLPVSPRGRLRGHPASPGGPGRQVGRSCSTNSCRSGRKT